MLDFNLSGNNKVRFFITVFLSFLGTTLLTISVGFSALNQNLNISGDVIYDAHSNILYDVLKKASNEGIYAKEYLGNHDDSYLETGDKSIYYWYGSNTANANVILDKWNVIFGGFCWQMFRTTDTGGVKLIYNGLPIDNKCNNVGTDQQIGTSKFNRYYTSIADSGYMYNKRYTLDYKSNQMRYMLNSYSMNSSTSFYYGTDVTYDASTQKYNLTGVTQNTWNNVYSTATGLYTCKSSTSTSCSQVYYIAKGVSNGIYAILMSNGNLLNYYNKNVVFGESYTESNGLYTLVNTSTVNRLDWYNNHNYNNYYTCGDSSTSCSIIYHVFQVSNEYYAYVSSDKNYLYSKNFSYNNATNQYSLNLTDSMMYWDLNSGEKSIKKYYTCFNETGQCEKLSYVLAVIESELYRSYYIDVSNGNTIEEIVDEMLYDDNVNTIDSVVKAYIDGWYQSNMNSYTNKIEDTIFCNDRTLSNWDGDIGFYFDHGMNCLKETDKFSINNLKAKLNYPVGLPTKVEMDLLGSSTLRKTGVTYWLLSSHDFSYNYLIVHDVSSYGNISSVELRNNNMAGVRPVISLKPGTEYTSGDGSKNNPYIID